MGGWRRRRFAPFGCGACVAPVYGCPWLAALGGWWCRGEVPGVDESRGVGRAQGHVSPVRQRVVQLCSLCNRAERLHVGWTQVEVAAMAGDDEPGSVFCRTVSWDPAQPALCSSASLWWEVSWANKNVCSVWFPRTRRLS